MENRKLSYPNHFEFDDPLLYEQTNSSQLVRSNNPSEQELIHQHHAPLNLRRNSEKKKITKQGKTL